MDKTPVEFSELQNRAYNVGYELEVNPDTLEVTLTPNEDYMPPVKVITHKDNDGSYYFDCVIDFPTINTEKFLYGDSLEFYTEKWTSLAKFVTSLCRSVYIPDEDELEEN